MENTSNLTTEHEGPPATQALTRHGLSGMMREPREGDRSAQTMSYSFVPCMCKEHPNRKGTVGE